MSVTTRQAILTVSRQLLEAVLPPGVVIDCYADKVGALDYGTLERPLLLPADARVTGVCVSGECFHRDQVLIRVACSAFREVELSEILPDVRAHYERAPYGPRFVGWSGDAVGTPLGQPAGVPLRTVLEPWEKALVIGNFGHAPVMDAPFGKGPPDGTCMQYQLPLSAEDEPKTSQSERVCRESASLDDIRPKVAYVPCDGGVLLPDFEAERLLRDYGKPDDEPKPVKFREFL